MSDWETRVAPGGLDLGEVADALRGLGYDIEPASPNAKPAASLVARRERGERAVLVAIDASGRFRVELTWRVGEWPSETVIGDVALRIVDSVTRAINASGQATTTAQVSSIIAGIDEFAPWTRRG
jgi:hypothetical protein